MARYTGPVCRLCRREGLKLFLKGTRCYSEKCPIAQGDPAPGFHGRKRKKLSEYGAQLREKQKTKRYYGVLETQFRKYFQLANKRAGMTGENLLSILETRLDNVVYRLGFGLSRPEARQLVIHGHFLVNGKRVNIPSYLIKAGDTIAICDKSKDSPKIKAILEITESKLIPDWLTLNKEKLSANVVRLPSREHIDIPIEEHLIVELYSK